VPALFSGALDRQTGFYTGIKKQIHSPNPLELLALSITKID
jgi:hypothetical protein